MNKIHSGRMSKNEVKKPSLFPVAAVCTVICAVFCVSFLSSSDKIIPVSSGGHEESGFWEDYSRFAAEIFEALF